MNKTPVSILQEMMVKKGTIPNYELIHDGGGTHMNTFTFQVTCDGLSATGTGRCKKDARHEAANAMLEAIAAHRGYPQLPETPAQSPIRTPLPPTIPASPRIPPNMPFHDDIGALQELCAENNLQDPEYYLTSEIGPPHAKIFTYQCVVSAFKEEGIATKKKLARHEAARKMFERLTEVIADLKYKEISMEETENREDRFSEMAKDRYPMLSKISQSKKINLGLKLSDYHNALKNCFDEPNRNDGINKLNHFIPGNNKDDLGDFTKVLSEFKDILSSLNLELQYTELTAHEESSFVVCIRIIACPDITEIEMGETLAEAQFKTLIKLKKTITFLLT